MKIAAVIAFTLLLAACQPQPAALEPSPSPSPSPSASAAPTAVALPTPTGEIAVPNDPNAPLSISGVVKDEDTGQPIANACVTVGRPVVCWTRTDAEGRFTVGFPAAAPPGIEWELYALKQPEYAPRASERIKVNGKEKLDIVLKRG